MGELCLTFCLFSLWSAYVGWGSNAPAAPDTRLCGRHGVLRADCLHPPAFICGDPHPKARVLRGGPLGREGAALVNGIAAPRRRLQRAPSPLPPREDTARSLWSATQEAGPRQTLRLLAA